MSKITASDRCRLRAYVKKYGEDVLSSIDALISNVKKIFVKCPSQVLKFKKIAPEVLIPPQPILTS